MKLVSVPRSLFWPAAAVATIALALACGDHLLTDAGGPERDKAVVPAVLDVADPGCTDEDCPPDPGCTDEDCPPDPGCTDEDCPPDPGCTDEDCPPDPGCTDEDCPPQPCTNGDCPPYVVVIDVKPGSDPNSINCTNGMQVIPVALLTTDVFDATTVDHTTVAFDGATELHSTPQGLQRHEADVDGDGDVDLVFHFYLADTGLTCSSVVGTLTGQTFDGLTITGTDAVRMLLN